MNFLSFFLLLVRAPRGGNIPSERQNWVPSVDMRSSSWPHMFAVKSPFFFFFTPSISPLDFKALGFQNTSLALWFLCFYWLSYVLRFFCIVRVVDPSFPTPEQNFRCSFNAGFDLRMFSNGRQLT